MEQVKQYFENHETVNQLYFTSDGLAFFDEVNAINHAGNLDDATIIAKTRDEVESELEQLTDGLEYDLLDEPDAE